MSTSPTTAQQVLDIAPAEHHVAPGLPAARLRVRVSAGNPNHHLWNNHGTWFLHYTIHPTPFTKQRVRRSLGTPSLETARDRRDAFFAHWESRPGPAALQAVA